MGFAVLNPSYELSVAGRLLGRLFELEHISRRLGLRAVGDPARQPRNASPHFSRGTVTVNIHIDDTVQFVYIKIYKFMLHVNI
jgi:hypothetical protein